MFDAAHTADRPLPSRSGRLLSLVRTLVAYGHRLITDLRQQPTQRNPAILTDTFGTSNLVAILARIALGICRARYLERKIVRTAAKIDAGPQPEPEPAPRAPRPARPRGPKLPPELPSNDTLSLLTRLPKPDQIAASVRRKSIGDVLADLCRDLGITRGHPLWDQLHEAIIEFGGNFVRLTMERLNRSFPIAHIVERLKAKPEAPPEPDSTGPPLPAAA
jgi:hypothetical protein